MPIEITPSKQWKTWEANPRNHLNPLMKPPKPPESEHTTPPLPLTDSPRDHPDNAAKVAQPLREARSHPNPTANSSQHPSPEWQARMTTQTPETNLRDQPLRGSKPRRPSKLFSFPRTQIRIAGMGLQSPDGRVSGDRELICQPG